MSFRDYSVTPSLNTHLGDGTFVGPMMLRNDVREAIQQLAADGRELWDVVQTGGGGGSGGTGLPAWYSAPTVITNGTSDNAAAINAALQSSASRVVLLPPGDIGIKSTIVIPSGKKLIGAGMNVTTIKGLGTFTKSGNLNAMVAGEENGDDIEVSDLTIDGGGLFNAGTVAVPNRLNGLFFYKVDGFAVRRVRVRNCSGYNNYAAGALNGTNLCRNGLYVDCISENGNTCYEPHDAADITYLRCIADIGDGDTHYGLEAYFIPYLACRRISFIDCRATGGEGYAWYITAITQDQEDITLQNCSCEVDGIGIMANTNDGTTNQRLQIIGGNFVSKHSLGAYFQNVEQGSVSGASFSGKTTSASTEEVAAFGVLVGADASMEFTRSHARGETTVGSVPAYAYGNSNPNTTWYGGSLTAVVSGLGSGPELTLYDLAVTTGATIYDPPLPEAAPYEGVPLAVTNHSNTTVTGVGALGWYRVEKTSGGSTAPDGRAKTAVTLEDDFHVSIHLQSVADSGAVGTVMAFGLTAAPNTAYNSMPVAIVNVERVLYFGRGGALTDGGFAAAGVFLTGKTYKMIRTAGVITFWENERELGSIENTDTLGLDLGLWTQGDVVYVKVGEL